MLLRTVCVLAAISQLFAQSRREPQPIYRVNIVERTTPALNYGHLTEPTKIGFAGTALLPESRGEATVETKRGAVLVSAHFQNVPPATRFGSGYLTYVLWAISPEGRAQNLGEIVLDGANKGGLTASAAMQAFALIVTAEPYFSVSQPSDVVVMENRVRPDTVAKVEQVNATYELLPRKEYTYSINPADARTAVGGPPVSMKEYEAITARYQAQNAIQIALAAGAQQYAPERIAHAQQLLMSAQRLSAKELSTEVVATAREAAQIAEDARVIAVKRAEEERAARERSHDEELRREAEQSRADANIAAQRAQLQAERAQLESQRAAMAAPPRQIASADRLRTPPPDDSVLRSNRARLTQYLRGYFQALDTPRGVVVVIPDTLFDTSEGTERVRMRLASLQSALNAYRGLRFEVDGYPDSPSRAAVSQARAAVVRDMLIAEGIPAASVVTGYGTSRSGPGQNRRVEIVITGAAIGNAAAWDHAYSLKQ